MMTAHPESVVGWLKSAQAAHDAVFDAAHLGTFDRLSSMATLRNVNAEHAPALLAALEKVWADCHSALKSRNHELSDCDDGIRAMADHTIRALAPLFEKPEKTT